MATAIAALPMSLDGVIADPTDVAGRQLNGHGSGEAAVPTADPQLVRRDVRRSCRGSAGRAPGRFRSCQPRWSRRPCRHLTVGQ